MTFHTPLLGDYFAPLVELSDYSLHIKSIRNDFTTFAMYLVYLIYDDMLPLSPPKSNT